MQFVHAVVPATETKVPGPQARQVALLAAPTLVE